MPTEYQKPSTCLPVSAAGTSSDSDLAPVIRRLGPRLEHLFNWSLSAGPFDDIWDLCCDHGRLGLHLHQELSARKGMRRPTIHLVDSVPAITAKLVEKYACYIDDHLVIECKDARSIEWRIDTSHLMILAGIGGSTMVDIIKGIINKPVTHHHKPVGLNIEFILSPNRNAFELRSFLRDRNFELIKEEFVTEKDWHHEHLHLRYHTEIPCMKPVSATGDDLWAGVSDEKKSYIRMQIKHYEKRAALGGHEASKSALEEYTRLLRRMESTIG